MESAMPKNASFPSLADGGSGWIESEVCKSMKNKKHEGDYGLILLRHQYFWSPINPANSLRTGVISDGTH